MRVPAQGGGPGSVSPTSSLAPRGPERGSFCRNSPEQLRAAEGRLGTSRVSPTPCRRCSLLPLGQAGKLRHIDGDDVLGSEPEPRVPAFSPHSPASCLSWKTLPLDVRFVGRTNTGLELSGSLPVADRSGLDFGHSSPGATRPGAVILSSECGLRARLSGLTRSASKELCDLGRVTQPLCASDF